MAVQDIECQIATGQIERYLAGGSFSAEALRQLEEHIADCNNCKRLINQRKAVLVSMLGYANAVVDEVEPPKTGLAAILQRFSKATHSSAPTPAGATKPTQFIKPLIYSIALIGVLLGMNYYSRSLTTPFGNHVVEADSTPAESPATPVAEPPDKSVVIPVYTDFKPAPILDQPKATTPAPATASASGKAVPTPAFSVPSKPNVTSAEPVAKPAAQTAKPIARPVAKAAKPAARKPRAIVRRIRTAASTPSGVRVYDPQGNLLPPR